MKYKSIVNGRFLERPNRFIAKVMIQGKEETVHVKNTGRCRELLVPGAVVYMEDHGDSMGARKTRWDLVAVEKSVKDSGYAHWENKLQSETLLINMDSQAPNKVVAEALRSGVIRLPSFSGEVTLIKAESVFGSSRFDFYVEGVSDGTKDAPMPAAYIEVKGVTLEEDGVARFPDAPTERGVKHINELCAAKKQGFEAYIIFIIQMKMVKRMEPNDKTHKAFGDALRDAREQGVHILAYDCTVEVDSLSVAAEVPVLL